MREAVCVPQDRILATHDLVSAYVVAKKEVVRAGHLDEIADQRNARVAAIDHISFTREAAWVVLSTGMREQVIRSLFGRLGETLHHWDPHEIAGDERAAARALTVFRHPGKITAIRSIAATVAALTRCELRHQLQDDPKTFLLRLPFIGPVTWAHLAKNLGTPVAKADRHLVRLARACRRASAADLCSEIGSWLSEPISVVDVVLWRYAVLHARQCSSRPCLPHVLPFVVAGANAAGPRRPPPVAQPMEWPADGSPDAMCQEGSGRLRLTRSSVRRTAGPVSNRTPAGWL
ncbi:hypothetical protein PSA01_68260 [Pseudonocardia saturnea]|uniref:HhH-GPD domain-containing protein n=1 Tax=Pseudonocardia saturnea TaxID=33909 RepID=A0ABQ0SA63_9PSEU|nr:hypothetical protein Pdca_15640 [Pseudonocardia autotrophica]GEC29797.1 hypothetical protein PSA01_68260 [Pseudonocardia saturnea]